MSVCMYCDAHLSVHTKVRFVAHHTQIHRIVHHAPQLLHPRFDTVERVRLRNVKHQDGGVRITVVHWSHGTEPLLTCRIPYLAQATHTRGLSSECKVYDILYTVLSIEYKV